MAQFAGLVPMIQSALGITSGVNGIVQNYQTQQYQDKLRSLAQNPKAMQQYIAGFKQPLAQGLVQGVENQAQGYAAERGLATSPALETQIVSQAIAPYIQQQQNQATQDAFQALGLGGGAQPNPGAGFQGLSSGLQALLPLMRGKNIQNVNQLGYDPALNQPWDPGTYGGDLPALGGGGFPTSSTTPGADAYQIPPIDLTQFGFGGQ